ALAGAGIAYLPLNLIRQELEDGRLVPILDDYSNSQFEFSLYFRPRKQMPTRCVNFKEFLLRRVKEISQEE
ncbi:LysR substrate-binding domain-containing protein, partial [Shewanella sp. T24-MNA-CIBAN-0130]